MPATQLDLTSTPPITPELAAKAAATNGFMPVDEGIALHAAAHHGAAKGMIVEIGTWCGKSTLLLADAARAHGRRVLTVDHHRGSEENQAGWEHHDASLVDPHTGLIDTLPHLRRTLHDAAVEDTVIVAVGQSRDVAALFGGAPGLVFIDGGHGEEWAQGDYEVWVPHLPLGALLAVHDVFPDPADGGQAPWHVIQRALASGAFDQVAQVGSLRVLERVGPGL